jgi:hypothetical protein
VLNSEETRNHQPIHETDAHGHVLRPLHGSTNIDGYYRQVGQVLTWCMALRCHLTRVASL